MHRGVRVHSCVRDTETSVRLSERKSTFPVASETVIPLSECLNFFMFQAVEAKLSLLICLTLAKE